MRKLGIIGVVFLVGLLWLASLPVSASPGWISPTGFIDGGSVWTDETLAYDEDTLTFAYVSCPAGWSDYLELTVAEITCDKVQVWMGRVNTQVTTVEIDVYYNSAWDNIYSGAIVTGSFQEFVIGSEQLVTAMRVRFSASKVNRQAEIYEVDFNEVSACSPDIGNLPIEMDFGLVPENSTSETGLTHFTVTNNSGGPVTIIIQAIDFSGGNGWTLSDTATPGIDTVGLKAGLEGEDYTIIVRKTESYNILVSGLPDEATQRWGLKLYTATEHSDGVQKSTTVTLVAVCD